LAQAKDKANDIMSSNGSGSGTGTSPGTGGKPSPTDQHDQLQVLRNAEQHGDITAADRQKYANLLFSTALSAPDAGTGASVGGPTIGWPDTGIAVASTHKAGVTPPTTSWNSSAVQIFQINREPIAGLSTALALGDGADQSTGKTKESPVQRCVALVPWYLDSAQNAVDALVHFHGYNIGSRQAASADFIPLNSVIDVDLDEWESQLGNWGVVDVVAGEKRGRHLIGVLAQGTDHSVFGSGPNRSIKNLSAYLTEVLGAFSTTSLFPVNPTVGRLVLTAHSGGGFPLIGLLSAGMMASNLSMVIILEAINGSGELAQWESWITSRLAGEHSLLAGKNETDQLAILDQSLRFFGFYGIAGTEYATRYEALKQVIDQWFANHANGAFATAAVRDKWRQNYVVKAIGGAHPGLVGTPSAMLGGLRPIEYALIKWQPK
jgi:hypothetical protein